MLKGGYAETATPGRMHAWLVVRQSGALPDRHVPIILLYVCQGERTKFDRFVDPSVRGAQPRVYSDLRIYCN